jgi:hypothetical protein
MARKRKPVLRVCSVTGIETNENNFYKNHTHVKAVDNLRRTTGATKDQMARMFNQINQYV